MGRIGNFGDGMSSAFNSVDGQGGSVTVPGGDWLLHAKFAHAGADLLLTGEDGAQLLVRDYFAQMTLPDLVTDHGAVIGGGLAARLAGPLAPGQFAQAGDAPAIASVGSVSKLTGDASVRHADGTSAPLKQGDQIFQGDVIQTGSNGQIGITFDDGAVFSLGQKGRMTVDEMTWDPATAKGTEALSVVSGPFSFVSGEIAKTGIDAMSIKTPVATIGVRGTTGAGLAAPEGQPNRITLMPNADGTVGELAVSNQAGVQVMSVPGATTQIASAFLAPPPPVILTPQQIQQQYGGALQVLPPPPTPQQIQQNIQQKGSQAPTEKAVQTAQVTAAEKAATEKAATEKAVAADKALGEKLGVEKAQIAKLTAEKALTDGVKLAETKIADALSQALGLTPGQANDIATKTSDAVAKVVGPTGPVGVFGPGQTSGFDLGAQINQVGAQIQNIVQQTIQNQIQQIQQQAASQSTITHTLTGGPQSVTLTDGVNDSIVGTANQGNEVSVVGYFGSGDTFYDPTLGDGDRVTINVGAGTTNTFAVVNVETVDLTGSMTTDQGMGIKNVDIASDGTTSIYVSYGVDNLTGTLVNGLSPSGATGNQEWHIIGHLGVAGADSIDMAGGTNSLYLDSTGTHVINAISNVQSLHLANGATNSVTFQAPVTGMTITGGDNTDSISLAAGANAITVSAVESVTGGSGIDVLTLGSDGQSVTVSGVESIVGGSGADTITLASAGTITVTSVETLVGSAGTDVVQLGSGGQTINVTNVESLIGGSGADDVTTTNSTMNLGSLTMSGVETISDTFNGNTTIIVSNSSFPGSVTTVFSADAAGTDIFETNSNSLNLVGVTLTNIDTIEIASGGSETFTVDGASLAAVTSIVGAGASASATITTATWSTLDVSAKTLTNVTTLSSTYANGCTITDTSTAHTLSGGATTGNTDTLIGGGGADTLTATSNGGSTIFRYEASGDFGDTITTFTAGGTKDAVDFLVSGFTAADKLLTTGDGSSAVAITAANATTAFQTVASTGDFTATAGNDVFIFSHSSFSSASALQTAINTGGGTVITLGNAGIGNGGRFLAAYDNGTVTRIATITIGNGDTDTSTATVTDVATLSNVSDVTTLTTSDFHCV
ncbi:hypothetical protein CU669_03855 [Paramagnetospirillum kuznetsovii]|uniref:FecR protein domain-containing protein n=1 Tax=Paramagnetospirillum kuznetsovii TaxID=2053833 RepID=A0A364P1R8_9PROT|nr:FecR domain-containing protein [Paramagnetospirillum kuznetsovii]RAU23289.1 hypothetical protein CU669_03855 [Paramagnetospirillum kuznetsovii]